MSVSLAKKTIAKFLETDVPEVICITGKWGVGKTYAWKTFFGELSAEGKIKLPYYSYVSLFGISSVDELRQTIFEDRTSSNNVELSPTLDSLREKVKQYYDTALQKVSRTSKYAKIPYVENYLNNFSGGFRHIMSLTVKDAIVCFDDFERKGKGLRTADVLGVISQLKETKECKIVVILNDDALSEEDKPDFEKYFEKVVDAKIEFAPTAEESVEIALRGTDNLHGWLRSACIDLNISNIRIIKKIERLAVQVGELLKPFEADVTNNVVRSLCVLAWSFYSRVDAPTIEFLKTRRNHQRLQRLFGAEEDIRFTDEEVGWGVILDSYGFTNCDDLDLALLDGIQRGFFDEEKVLREAAKYQENARALRGNASLEEAWKPFHESFGDNVDEVVTTLFDGSMKNVKFVNLGTLNSAVSLLKKLGAPEKAQELIAHYASERAHEEGLFDLSNNPFSGHIDDPDVLALCNERAALTKMMPTPIEACKKIHSGSWSSSDEETLSLLTADQFYSLFKGLRGDDRHSVVQGCFLKIDVLTDRQKLIRGRAKEALMRIAKESDLNRLRMKTYRLQVD